MALIVCPECGHEISDKAPACPHCGYPLAAQETQSVSEKVVDNADDSKALQKANPAAFLRKHRRLFKLLFVAVILAVVVAAIILAGVKFAPRVAYAFAENAFESENYSAAIKWFGKAREYEDAQDRLQEAEEIYEFSEHYASGVTAIESENYNLAVEEFNKAKNFSDAPQKLQDATYMLAKSELESGQYVEASKHLSSITDYKDADNLIIECGKALLADGNYGQAESAFSMSSSNDGFLYAKYASAMLAYEEKRYDEAAKLFDASNKVTEDADGKSLECKYLFAEEALAGNRYDEARTYYLKIPQYKDSREKGYACSLMIAIQDIRNGRLSKAKSVLESLPDDLEYKGQSVKEQLDLLNDHSEFVDICGEWSASGTCTIKVTQTHISTGIWHNWTAELESPAWYKLSILCPISADGNVSMIGSVTFDRFTNYSSISEYLENADKTVSFTRNVTELPYKLDIGNHTSLTYSNGEFHVSYSETVDNEDIYFDYTYESEFIYGKHETPA